MENIRYWTTLARAVAGYLGIIESTGVKVALLVKSELGSALSALEQAINSKTEQISLLRAARDHFNKASQMEKEERLALAYFGLALCHHYLDDFYNAIVFMKKVVDTDFYIKKPTLMRVIFSWDSGLLHIPKLMLKTEAIREAANQYLINIAISKNTTSAV